MLPVVSVAALLVAYGGPGPAQTTVTNQDERKVFFRLKETSPYYRETPPSAPIKWGNFTNRADVYLDSKTTNTTTIEIDRRLVDAVQNTWRILLDLHYNSQNDDSAPPVASITLEFQLHPDGQVTDLRIVEGPKDWIVSLAQVAVMHATWNRKWGDLKAPHNIRLKFSLKEEPKSAQKSGA